MSGGITEPVAIGADRRRAVTKASSTAVARRVLHVAIGVEKDVVRVRCHVDMPVEVEAAIRSALAAGGGTLVVHLEDVTTIDLCALAHARDERLEMERRVARLSRAERKVLTLLAEGLTNRQIADRLFLAPKTVKNYVSSLLCKLDMSRRTEAAVFAARLRDDFAAEQGTVVADTDEASQAETASVRVIAAGG
jgi:DNA-binding NarL/FixJ family response regulator